MQGNIEDIDNTAEQDRCIRYTYARTSKGLKAAWITKVLWSWRFLRAPAATASLPLLVSPRYCHTTARTEEKELRVMA